jgi:hypothetical protein
MLDHNFKYLIMIEETSICDAFTRLSKVKQFMYTHGLAVKVPGNCFSHISRQSGYEVSKFVSPRYRPPLLPKIFLVFFCVGG